MAGEKRKADVAINVTDELSATGAERAGTIVRESEGVGVRIGYGYDYGQGYGYGYGYGNGPGGGCGYGDALGIVVENALETRQAEKSADESKGTTDNTPSC